MRIHLPINVVPLVEPSLTAPAHAPEKVIFRLLLHKLVRSQWTIQFCSLRSRKTAHSLIGKGIRKTLSFSNSILARSSRSISVLDATTPSATHFLGNLFRAKSMASRLSSHFLGTGDGGVTDVVDGFLVIGSHDKARTSGLISAPSSSKTGNVTSWEQ
jgi:hypothetical protein